MITLIKHADRIKIACQSELLNVIAPIMTIKEGCSWRQTIYYLILHASVYGRNRVLNLNIKSPVYHDDEFDAVHYIDGVATVDEENATLTIFAVNRSLEESIALEGDARDYADYEVFENIVLTDEDIMAGNTADNPNHVVPKSIGQANLTNGKLSVILPRASWNVIRLTKKNV